VGYQSRSCDTLRICEGHQGLNLIGRIAPPSVQITEKSKETTGKKKVSGQGKAGKKERKSANETRSLCAAPLRHHLR